MGYEALRDLKTKNIEIQAPLADMVSPVLAENFTIVPILRAGLGMVDGLRRLSPTAQVGHIGLQRDEKTLKPITYYYKMPVNLTEGPVIIVDPALATGGSVDASIKYLKDAGSGFLYKMLRKKNITLNGNGDMLSQLIGITGGTGCGKKSHI